MHRRRLDHQATCRRVGARVVYHARKLYVHVASAFPLARYYRILVPEFLQHDGAETRPSNVGMMVCPEIAKTGPVDLSIVFHVRISDDSMGLQRVPRTFPRAIRLRMALLDSLVVELTHYLGLSYLTSNRPLLIFSR